MKKTSTILSLFFWASAIIFAQPTSSGKTVTYHLYIADTTVTFGGDESRAIAVNGTIPMPTLTFTEGDTAEIWVHNNLDEETALHWHGLFLPNRYDGVANLTQTPIQPHTTHLYKFPVIQTGTHWYHSHFRLQEQIGMYGAFIMLKRNNEPNFPTLNLILSEWTNMNPEEVNRSLKAGTDWFAIQKGSTQSYGEALTNGHFGTKIVNEWKRMLAMDVSDIYYDNFLINGKNQTEHPEFKKGDKVRLRIANAGASDYFWLTYSGGKITVVASDGNDVEPVEVDRLIIAVSETYDVVVTIPDNKSYEFLATPEDRTGSASLWLGSGEKVHAKKLPTLKYFAGMEMMNDMMDMNGNIIEMEGMRMQNQQMDMNTVMYPEIDGDEEMEEMDMEEMNQQHEEKQDKEEMDEHQQHKQQEAKEMKDMDMNGMNHQHQQQDTVEADDHKQHEHQQKQQPEHQQHQHNMQGDIITLNYEMMKSTKKTTLPKGPIRELKFNLTGNMNRFVWTMDDKTISESDKILIKKEENLRIILFNNSMMRHPMHLHGHDFRLLNGQGDYAIMKNIIDIMPMERDTIEFAASESGGDWFFHCHILYHMMAGMGRVFSYENSPPNPDLRDPENDIQNFLNDHGGEFHLMGKAGLETNGSDGEVMYASSRWELQTLWHLGYRSKHGYESETFIGYYLDRMQWFFPYAGFDYHYKTEGGPENIFGSEDKNMFGQKSNKNNRKAAIVGIAYTLPMLFIADARMDSDGKFRFQLSREDISITSRLRMNLMVNTDKEYLAGFRYILTKYFSISTHYDSDMGAGIGITLTY